MLAALGCVAGIAVAAWYEQAALVPLLALVAIVGAVVAVPLLLRLVTPETENGPTLSPYAEAERLLNARAPAPPPPPTHALLRLADNAYDLHVHLSPILRRVVIDLLALRTHVDYGKDPEAIRTLIGPQLWDLIGRDHTDPIGRVSDPGLTREQLRFLIDDLERINS